METGDYPQKKQDFFIKKNQKKPPKPQTKYPWYITIPSTLAQDFPIFSRSDQAHETFFPYQVVSIK